MECGGVKVILEPNTFPTGAPSLLPVTGAASGDGLENYPYEWCKSEVHLVG